MSGEFKIAVGKEEKHILKCKLMQKMESEKYRAVVAPYGRK